MGEEDIRMFEEDGRTEEEFDLTDIGNCPECNAPLTDGDNWSGIKCTKCNYWFCY